MNSMMYMILLLAIFYFLLIRPQQKQRKQRQELMNSLEVGQKIVTIGGIHGEIQKIEGDTVTLKVAENVELVFQKTAVAFAHNDKELNGRDDSQAEEGVEEEVEVNEGEVDGEELSE